MAKQPKIPPTPVEREIRRHEGTIGRLEKEAAELIADHEAALQKLKSRIENHRAIIAALRAKPAGAR